ncbi:MAG: dienelactone hydrolase family protein [Acidobacteriota bacterium]|nr:dienelactone hydrolase family protein [Acidobacteriota bacterium]
MSEWVQLKAADGHKLSAYVARPEGDPVGALVVIQEIFGVNPPIRAVADAYAKDGFATIAPALFDRFERGLELGYTGDDLKKAFELYGKLNPDTQLLDVAAACEHVAGAGKGTGVIGFCYGGLLTWLSATRAKALKMDLKAAVGYYAGGIGKFASEQPSCPVQLHFGADDDHIGKDQVDAVRTAHPNVKIYLYEGAGHAFANEARTSYVPAASDLAHQRSLEFLRSQIAK